MGWIEFAAAVIGDVLSWPVVTLIIALLLLKPIRKLIGRVKAAKGFGGEVEFSELLENAEKNVDEVLAAKTEPKKGAAAADPTTPHASADRNGELEALPSKPDPSTDPSGAIIVSWQQLATTLEELNRSTAGPGRPACNPRAIIAQLQRNAAASVAFQKSAMSLLEARNQVAHGEVVPTQGAARTYVERAAQLESTARGMIHVGKMDLSKPVFGSGS